MPSRLGANLVHVDVIASLSARALPGEPLPDWADEPTEPGGVPATVTLRNWRESHVMAVFRVSKSRAETPGVPGIAVAVTIGALYKVMAFPATEALTTDTDDLLSLLPGPSLRLLAEIAMRDASPFARQAVHAASALVDPIHPLLITGLFSDSQTLIPLDEDQPATDPGPPPTL